MISARRACPSVEFESLKPPTIKVLLSMALGQRTGFVESLLRLNGLDRAVPDFSTPSRRQRSLMGDIPIAAPRVRGVARSMRLRLSGDAWKTLRLCESICAGEVIDAPAGRL